MAMCEECLAIGVALCETCGLCDQCCGCSFEAEDEDEIGPEFGDDDDEL